MKILKTFFNKTGVTVLSAGICLGLSQCDSSQDLTFNPEEDFLEINRFNTSDIEGDLAKVVGMPDFLVSGDRVIVEITTPASPGLTSNDELIENDIDVTINSAGQALIGNFRFNYDTLIDSDPEDSFLFRSDDHKVGEGEDKLVQRLLLLRDSSSGSGSLAEALEIDPNDVGDGFVTLTPAEQRTIENAIRSLGYIVDDNLRVLGDQFITFQATSTNQLLLDEGKITGEVAVTRVWRSLLFQFVTVTDGSNIDDPVVVTSEYKLILGGETTEIDLGTFEINLNSL